MVYPDTQEDISELLHMFRMQNRYHIKIEDFNEGDKTHGIKFVY